MNAQVPWLRVFVEGVVKGVRRGASRRVIPPCGMEAAMRYTIPTPTFLAVVALLNGSPAAAQLASPNDEGVTWGHIHMNVTDVERHQQIWIEHFGGTRVDLDLVSTIRLPNTIIMLNERAPTGGTRGSAVDHFGFSVPDLGNFLDRWRADGLEVENEFEGSGGTPQAYVTLPDGIRANCKRF